MTAENPNFVPSARDAPVKLEYPKITLHQVLTETARAYPDDVAIAFSNQLITYRELDFLSDKIASSLAALGVEKGDCVAVFLPNLPQFVVAYFGILKANAMVTAISPLHREREVEHQLSDSGAKFIVTLDSLYPLVELVKDGTKLETAFVTSLEEFSDKRLPPNIPADKTDVQPFSQLLQGQEKPINISINAEQDLAALQYTGGTTGKAKAAMLTHANLVSNAYAFAAWIKGAMAKESFLTALPLFHIYGMTTSMNVPVVLASKMVLIPRFDPVKILESIQKHQVSVFCGVPTMYQALLANPELPKYDLTSVRVCISGASPLPPEVQRRFMQVTGGLLAEGYGLTEASPVTHCSPVDPTLRTVKIGSIGLPLPNTEARIVDLQTGTKTLVAGEVGELAVKGPQVMQGYWRNPEETKLVLRDGWLLTGDIATVDEDGYFYITDRKKDLIKYKDYSVYPRELEDVLYDHPAVKLCAVVGKPDLQAGEVPKAYVVLKEGASLTAEEIKQFVNSKVAPYKAIREIAFRKELPLSSAGKVLRRVLQEETMASNA